MISDNENGRFHEDDEDDDNLNYHENPDDVDTPATAGRPAVPLSLLTCRHAMAADDASREFALITFETPSGVVSELLLPLSEAKRLVIRLVDVLRRGEPRAAVPLKQWLVPHAVIRAELNVEELGSRALASLKADMPEVGEYLERELAALRRSLLRNPRARVETVLKRMERFVLTAVDAARSDT